MVAQARVRLHLMMVKVTFDRFMPTLKPWRTMWTMWTMR